MSTRKIRHTVNCETEDTFIRKWVNIYSCISTTEDKWLTKKEKTLFIAIVKAINEGRDLTDTDEVDLLCKEADLSRESKSFYMYRKRLEDKNWIVNTKTGIQVPPLFYFNTHSIDLELKLRNGKI